jgi:hypothetical protein
MQERANDNALHFYLAGVDVRAASVSSIFAHRRAGEIVAGGDLISIGWSPQDTGVNAFGDELFGASLGGPQRRGTRPTRLARTVAGEALRVEQVGLTDPMVNSELV